MVDWIAYQAGPAFNWFMIYVGGPIGWAMMVCAPIGLWISVAHVLEVRRSSVLPDPGLSPTSGAR